MQPRCCLYSILIASRRRGCQPLFPSSFFFLISYLRWCLELVRTGVTGCGLCTVTPKPWPNWTWGGSAGETQLQAWPSSEVREAEVGVITCAQHHFHILTLFSQWKCVHHFRLFDGRSHKHSSFQTPPWYPQTVPFLNETYYAHFWFHNCILGYY